MTNDPPPKPPRLFLPTTCPECDRILSPAEKPTPGDRATCPECDAPLVFVASGIFVRVGSAAPDAT